MKMIYVTEAFPFGYGEAFIIPELLYMRNSKRLDLVIIPLVNKTQVKNKDAAQFLPQTIATGRFEWKFMLDMILTGLLHPVRTLIVLSWLRRARSFKVFLRNVYSFPKGFWLARCATRLSAGHIHANFAVSSSSIAMVASKLSGIPWSFTAHRYDIVENDLLDVKIENARFARFISESGIALARKRAIDTTKGNVILLHMGVEIPRPIKNDLDRMERKKTTILCPANLYPVKGHVFLLEAIALIRKAGHPVHLMIAGDGELRDKLEHTARQLDIVNEVSFLGHVSHEDLMHMYADKKVDIVILPSLDLGKGLHEGIPVALIEAMSNEVPVIATDTGGIPELLHDGAGVLVPQRDPQALADAIVKLCNEKICMRDLAVKGKKRIETEYNVQKIGYALSKMFAGMG